MKFGSEYNRSPFSQDIWSRGTLSVNYNGHYRVISQRSNAPTRMSYYDDSEYQCSELTLKGGGDFCSPFCFHPRMSDTQKKKDAVQSGQNWWPYEESYENLHPPTHPQCKKVKLRTFFYSAPTHPLSLSSLEKCLYLLIKVRCWPWSTGYFLDLGKDIHMHGQLSWLLLLLLWRDWNI